MTTVLPQPTEDGWTIDDLERLPTALRSEVHNGELVIMSPTRLWHQRVERRICNLPEASGRHAGTQVGVRRTARDARVAEVGVFRDRPTDSTVAWHDASWYANRGIPEYWLAEPIEGETCGALITMHKLARTPAGESAYIRTGQTTLAELEKSGLPA